MDCFATPQNASVHAHLSRCDGNNDHSSDSFFHGFHLLKEKYFLMLLFVLCLFRYSLVAIAIPYACIVYQSKIKSFFENMIILTMHKSKFISPIFAISIRMLRKNSSSLNNISILWRIFQISVFLFIVFLLSFAFSWAFLPKAFLNYSFCDSFQALILLLGFREAFGSSSCFAGFDPSNFANILLRGGIGDLHLLNYTISILFGFLNLVITVLGLIGICLVKSPRLKHFVLLSFASMACISFLLGIGHYRYLVPILPLIYLGLFILLERINSKKQIFLFKY
jgi:hypothetical protein